MITPRYPVYVPTKGRFQAKRAMTAKFMLEDGVDFRAVVEPQEAKEYERLVGKKRVLVLPFSNLGLGSIPARNWIKRHATAEGAARHWQFDDNIRCVLRYHHGQRIRTDANIGLAVVEDFTDRYTNVAVSGMNYEMFMLPGRPYPPFYLNCRVYSATLVNNEIPNEWRGRYNEDTDLCLQVLAQGWCTVLVNQFLARKAWTMAVKGGNTDQLYQGDGRLHMARSLERQWPGIVTTQRRFQRPQHVVPGWEDRKFDTPLVEKADDDPTKPPPRDYGLKLRAVGRLRSSQLAAMLDE